MGQAWLSKRLGVVPPALRLFAFFICEENKVTLILHVVHGSVSVKQKALHNKDFARTSGSSSGTVLLYVSIKCDSLSPE